MNRYNLFKEYGVGYTRKGQVFYFDLDDFEKICRYTWWIDAQGYVRSETSSGIIKMHNLVMSFVPSKNRMIDHIHRRKFDNRKSQLRLVTKQQNALNGKLQSNNTSGVRGVHLAKTGMWQSYIKVKGTRINFPTTKYKRVAIKQRLEAEKKYFGEFSPQKHLFSEYGITND